MNKKTKNTFFYRHKNTFLIDIAVTNTHNLAKTIIEKQNKYQELANEMCTMWKQKATQVIPIVISSTGVFPKSLSQSLTSLNLHSNTCIQLQKSVILGTCSVVRNFLNYNWDHRAKYEERRPTRFNNYKFIINLSQHVSDIIMPIFRRTKALLLHLVCCSGSAGCGW